MLLELHVCTTVHVYLAEPKQDNQRFTTVLLTRANVSPAFSWETMKSWEWPGDEARLKNYKAVICGGWGGEGAIRGDIVCLCTYTYNCARYNIAVRDL